MNNITADIVIVGGGIAGLWNLNYLNNIGVNTILLESDNLGCGQTIKSQGIIHGGLKYALQGVLSKDAQAIANMPKLWKQCLDGIGNINLTATEVLSNNQYLFSTGSLSSKITSFFASRMLRSKIKAVKGKDFINIFGDNNFSGNLYQLDEMVVNVQSLIKNLADNYSNKIIKIDNKDINIVRDINQSISSLQVQINSSKHNVIAQEYIFCAGENNKKLYQHSSKTDMQLRPLHMVYLIGNELPKLYGHCVDGGMLPKATITTHYTKNGTPVWYIGGKPAESGLDKDSDTQVKDTIELLKSIFSWINFENLDSKGSFFISRAESKQDSLAKPENATAFKEHNYIIAWPTKLALAPILAEEVYKLLNKKLFSKNQSIDNYSAYPHPDIASYPWDQSI